MKKLVLLAGAVSLSLAASAALAGGPDKAPATNNNGLYAGVNGGVAIPTNSNGDVAVKTGYNVGAQVGYKLSQFRLEEAYNFFSNNYKQVARDLGAPKRLEMSTLMTNGYYDFNTGTNFVPFVGAGIGWLHAWTSADNSKTDNEFAYQGIAGVDYKLNKNMTVGVNYHYLTWSNSDDSAQNVINATFNYYF